MQTFHLHINGIVQGVGFRPMVYQLANQMQLTGCVKNGSDGVHVFFNAEERGAMSFFENIMQCAPDQSKIISSQLQKIAETCFTDFSIVMEEEGFSVKRVLVSPDVAMCSLCKTELHDNNNRRHRYPFITCTRCGPRYSIINSLPYERHNTAMEKFRMCRSCNNEYNTVTDRRFFSQTNSCADCGLQLTLWKSAGAAVSVNSQEILSNIKELLLQGKILAVKGVGGYLLLCSANNAETIHLLRKRKQRPLKPLAVLFPGMEIISNNFEMNEHERVLLKSDVSPIVLMYPKQEACNNVCVNDIAPGLKRLGIMLPYSPLLEVIANDYGMPLIATSANISGSPIIYKDDDALEYLFEIADFVVSYNRDIVVPQDDSVVQVSKYTGRQIIVRRSRGYAPSFLDYQPKKQHGILSTGAFLKSSFTLSVNGNVFVSQFLGSGARFESQQMFRNTVEHWLKMYEVKPAVLLTDKHPDYFSHQYAVELAVQYKVDIQFIQHHEAHFAAILAEKKLLNSAEPVLGVVWDGTGFGTDRNIWGGEFFKYENNEMLRCCHVDYFPAIAGDKLALEPRIAALCIAGETWPYPETLREKFTDAEWNNYQALISKASILSSSVGRVFDAVASLLDVCDKQSFEGEAAMYLQVLAEEYVEESGFVMDESYFEESLHHYRIPTASIIQGIGIDIKKDKPKNYIAAKFHYSMVRLIDIVASNTGVRKICFSGGVFQNALLVDWIQKEYGNNYQLYFHQQLSPNDENISFGQMVYYDNDITTAKVSIDQQKGIINHTFLNPKS